MPRAARRGPLPVWPVVLVALLVWVVSAALDREHPIRAAAGAPAAERAPTTILFDGGDPDPAPNALAALDPVVGRAGSDRSVRILVACFANDEPHLEANLKLAEKRARGVAAYLFRRAVDERRVVVAAKEAPVADAMGARCEVEVVAAQR